MANKINREHLYYILRYGYKNDVGCDGVEEVPDDEFVPSHYDVDDLITAWDYWVANGKPKPQ